MIEVSFVFLGSGTSNDFAKARAYDVPPDHSISLSYALLLVKCGECWGTGSLITQNTSLQEL